MTLTTTATRREKQLYTVVNRFMPVSGRFCSQKSSDEGTKETNGRHRDHLLNQTVPMARRD
jgi:hypothetical protein